MTENAQVKAKLEAHHEIAQHKERLIHEMVEAKIEVVKLQARLELANQREQLAHHPRVHVGPVSTTVTPIVERLRVENEVLRAKIAQLEQRLTATNSESKAASKNAREIRPSRR